jgi:uncharacterized protein
MSTTEQAPQEGPVTVVIRRTVRKGYESDFEEWLRGVGADVHDFHGHLGTNILRPAAGSREYTVIFRFDTYEHLMTWEKSETRHVWLERVQPLITGEVRMHRHSGLEYWFTVPDGPCRNPPPRWKMAVVTWTALAPLALVLPPAVQQISASLPHFVQVAIVAAAMVFTMTYAVMPVMTRLFARWLRPPPQPAE